jgi:hypothetical protein
MIRKFAELILFQLDDFWKNLEKLATIMDIRRCSYAFIPIFYIGPAKKSLRLFLRSDINDRDRYSYCGAVLFVLTTYAPEDQVNMERRKIFLSQQKNNESENDFAIRVQAEASRHGQAFY